MRLLWLRITIIIVYTRYISQNIQRSNESMCHRILFSLIIASSIIAFVVAVDYDDDENHCRLVLEFDHTKNGGNCRCHVFMKLHHRFQQRTEFFFWWCSAPYSTHSRSVGNCQIENMSNFIYKNCIWHWFNSMIWTHTHNIISSNFFPSSFCSTIPLKYHVRSVGLCLWSTAVWKMSLAKIHE